MPRPSRGKRPPPKGRPVEQAARASSTGLPVAIVRPTIVYGPFSALWVEEFAQRLQVRAGGA